MGQVRLYSPSLVVLLMLCYRTELADCTSCKVQLLLAFILTYFSLLLYSKRKNKLGTIPGRNATYRQCLVHTHGVHGGG
jgi:hypothetical protein